MLLYGSQLTSADSSIRDVSCTPFDDFIVDRCPSAVNVRHRTNSTVCRVVAVGRRKSTACRDSTYIRSKFFSQSFLIETVLARDIDEKRIPMIRQYIH